MKFFGNSYCPIYRTYTGHEDLWMFGLINANARLYSPYLGRFISPDPLLNSEGGPLDYNPYVYARNNPYKYIDRNGEFCGLVAFFLDFALNALFNAAVEASVYSITAAISGNWNAGDFFKSMGMAAVSSGLQVGVIGCGLGNNFAMGLMSNMVNNTVTGAIFGDGLSFGDIPGMVVGAAVGTILPYYTPSGTNVFKNVASEVGINMFRGALTGFSSGAINAMVHDDPSLVWEGTVGGAISGFARTAAHNIIMGTAYQPLNENGEPISYGEDVVYRKGGIAGMMDIGYGLTLGRHIYTLEKDLDSDHIMNLRFHENYHVGDINAMGVAKFYGSILMDYIRYGFKGSYTKPGTLEYNARVHAYMKTLLWW